MEKLDICMAAREDVPFIVPLWTEMMEYHHKLDARFQANPVGAAYETTLHEWLDREHIAIIVAKVRDDDVVGFAIGHEREGPPIFLPERYG